MFYINTWCDCHILWLTFTWLLMTFLDFSLTHYLTFLDLFLTPTWLLLNFDLTFPWLLFDLSWLFLTEAWLVSQFCSQKNRTLVNQSWLTFCWLFLDFSFYRVSWSIVAILAKGAFLDLTLWPISPMAHSTVAWDPNLIDPFDAICIGTWINCQMQSLHLETFSGLLWT